MKCLHPILIPTLIAVLLLASCEAPPPGQTDFYTGTDGLVLTWTQGSPPEEVYEDSQVPLFIELANRGAWDVPLDRILFNVTGDPFYVSVYIRPEDRLGVPVEEDPLYPEPEELADYLNGKSEAFPEGEAYETRSFVTFKQITGLRQKPTVQLYARACYPYRTILSKEVCVDLNSFNQNVQEQVCEAEERTFTGQGAPVAVTRVENRPVPFRASQEGGRGYSDAVQHVFQIHIKNVGRGAVLRPDTRDDEVRLAACAQHIDSDVLSGVGINASLGGMPLHCKPAIVQLNSGRGFTTCQLDPEDAVQLAGPSYYANLRVTLDYLYMEGIAEEVSIIRRPEMFEQENPTFEERDEHPGYINGVTRCEYCSTHRSDERCADWPEEANVTAPFSCACGEYECREKHDTGHCVYGFTWCPGGDYCCYPGRVG